MANRLRAVQVAPITSRRILASHFLGHSKNIVRVCSTRPCMKALGPWFGLSAFLLDLSVPWEACSPGKGLRTVLQLARVASLAPALHMLGVLQSSASSLGVLYD